ncbi:MAG: helix-turn-helix domain-containing protein [Bauldia sp.]|uniref:helix-turn-helix domain-containing protein n=1 Tax=Bauldia sp. TaxID=2575872 RepID=UPI001D664A52|nr:helix-turn-helix domain-containing protein [Bauldia sp.]MCB1495375.1 helix-turn-helix domain-containing protein [Bauldia sp.]
MTASHPDEQRSQIVQGRFDDIDALADAALDWDQEYHQIGRGRFHGELTQLVLGQVQLNREQWETGVLQSGAAPEGTWVFGLPLRADGPLHVRRQPVRDGELLAATSSDDVGFVAEGATDLMIVVLPNSLINRWMRARRGIDGIDADLPPRHWVVSSLEMARRSRLLFTLQNELVNSGDAEMTSRLIAHVEARISETIFDLIPSAETVESLPSRARIAREVLRVLHDRLDDPPTVTALCEDVGARERTLYLSCVEAFGRPPAQLLLELRLNAVRRALASPALGTTVTGAASRFGFTHLGRFSSMYARQFGELPSATLAESLGSN